MRRSFWLIAFILGGLAIAEFAPTLLRVADQSVALQAQGAERVAESEEDNGDELFVDGIESLCFGATRSVSRNARKLASIAGFENKALWLKARNELEYGQPADALRFLDKATALESSDAMVLDVYCETLFQLGKYDEYEEASKRFLKAHATLPRASYQRGRSLWLRGDGAADEFFRLAAKAASQIPLKADTIDRQFFIAEEYHAAGHAELLLNRIQSASEYWYDGTEAYQYHNGCVVSVGYNLLENGNKDRSALKNAAEVVLTYNASSVPALLLKAGAHGFRGEALQERAALDRAISTNRSSWAARMARAKYLISNGNYDAAKEDLDVAAKTNTSAMEYLSTMALYSTMRGNMIEAEKYETKARELNSKSGLFYLEMGKGLRSRLRSEDAAKMLERGLNSAPQDWRLHRELGFTYLDLGLAEKGLPFLRTALKNDVMRNSVDTQNMLILFDEYYEDLARFEILDGRVSLQIMKKDAALLIPYYERAFKAAFAQISKKYGGFEPKKPLYVDVFPDSDTFSVRTVGIKGIPASGVCFGQLINLAGPLALGADGYNWASTLVHELDHVYQLQLSNGQCPRWLAEGSSVYQERLVRPEWERHLEEELYQTYSADRLPSVETFDEWFRDGSKVMFAYYLGGVMVDFIVNEIADTETITRMIREFGAALSLPEVLQRNLKLSPKEFDAKFSEYVGKKLSKFKILSAVSLEDPRDLIEKAEDGEASLDELVKLARWYFQQDKASPDARKWAGLAVKRGGESAELYYVRGMLAKYDESKALSTAARLAQAKELLSKAINMGLEDYYLYLELAEIATASRDANSVLFYLNRARRAFPTSPEPLVRLIGVYGAQKNERKVQELAEALIRLQKNDVQYRSWLLTRYREIGDYERAADMALQMVFVNPYNTDTHLVRGTMLREIGDTEEAVFEYERAYDAAGLHEAAPAQAQGMESALLEIAQTWLEIGDEAKIKSAIERLEKEFPTSSRVEAFKRKMLEEDKEDYFP